MEDWLGKGNGLIRLDGPICILLDVQGQHAFKALHCLLERHVVVGMSIEDSVDAAQSVHSAVRVSCAIWVLSAFHAPVTPGAERQPWVYFTGVASPFMIAQTVTLFANAPDFSGFFAAAARSPRLLDRVNDTTQLRVWRPTSMDECYPQTQI